MGVPVPLWKDHLWAFFQGVVRRLDQRLAILDQLLAEARSTKQLPDAVVALVEKLKLENVVRWLRALSLLLPCEICRGHFSQEIAADFDPRTGKKPATSYFAWTVDVRKRISERSGRQNRSAEYCAAHSEFEGEEKTQLKWFGHSWTALQIMSFAYPPAANAETQAEADFFFRFTAILFPNADETRWLSLLDEQNARFKGLPSNPPLLSESVPWCSTRERMMLTVHRLRSEVQIQPVMTVLPLATIVQQWVTQLTEFVNQFRAAQQKQLENLQLQKERQLQAHQQAQQLANQQLADLAKQQLADIAKQQQQAAPQTSSSTPTTPEPFPPPGVIAIRPTYVPPTTDPAPPTPTAPAPAPPIQAVIAPPEAVQPGPPPPPPAPAPQPEPVAASAPTPAVVVPEPQPPAPKPAIELPASQPTTDVPISAVVGRGAGLRTKTRSLTAPTSARTADKLRAAARPAQATASGAAGSQVSRLAQARSNPKQAMTKSAVTKAAMAAVPKQAVTTGVGRARGARRVTTSAAEAAAATRRVAATQTQAVRTSANAASGTNCGTNCGCPSSSSSSSCPSSSSSSSNCPCPSCPPSSSSSSPSTCPCRSSSSSSSSCSNPCAAPCETRCVVPMTRSRKTMVWALIVLLVVVMLALCYAFWVGPTTDAQGVGESDRWWWEDSALEKPAVTMPVLVAPAAVEAGSSGLFGVVDPRNWFAGPAVVQGAKTPEVLVGANGVRSFTVPLIREDLRPYMIRPLVTTVVPPEAADIDPSELTSPERPDFIELGQEPIDGSHETSPPKSSFYDEFDPGEPSDPSADFSQGLSEPFSEPLSNTGIEDWLPPVPSAFADDDLFADFGP